MLLGVSPGQPSVKELVGRGQIITTGEINVWSARLPFLLDVEDIALERGRRLRRLLV
jgi:hypothetical protein